MRWFINIVQVVAFVFCTNTLFAQGTMLETPELKSVSIDPATGAVVVRWSNPNDPRITHCEISRTPYGGSNYSFNPIGTAIMPDSVYIDNAVSSINDNRQTYRIRSANATQYSSITSMHITMTLNAIYHSCENEIELRWTPYRQVFINSNGGVTESHEPENTFNTSVKYEVWGYEGSGAFNEASAVKLSNTISEFVDTIRGLTANSNYFLFVKALLPNGDTATTYRIEMPTATRKEPSFMIIDSVISANGNINLYFNIDNTTQLDTFALHRADITNRPIAWFRRNGVPTRYVDGNIQLGLTYNYYLTATRCREIVTQSDTVNNVLLNASSSGGSVILRWSAFTNKSGITYRLVRTSPAPVASQIFIDQYVYSDDVQSLLEDGNFEYCYHIVAEDGVSLARSETKCITLEPMITMPDAIDPLSSITNPNTGRSRNQFGPVLSFRDDKYRFTLEIFNKAGVRLFKSNKEFNDGLSPFHYWDGKHNNKNVREDVYIYTLKFEFKDRKPFVQNGTVTVVYGK